MSEQGSYQTITPEEFAGLDYASVTLVDLREPDEVLLGGIEGARNIPFSRFATELDTVPKGKPVYVYCRVGDFSEEVAEILADRGYEVYNLAGGYQAYREYQKAREQGEGGADAIVEIDAKGLRCPGPIVKTADTIRSLADGTVVRVQATEDAFYSDIRVWTERTGNELLELTAEGGVITAKIRKTAAPPAGAAKQAAGGAPNGEILAGGATRPVTVGNDKTFVVFSGDLDKTIAAFIMANGAASLGRSVTMFFTFWGLNILRKPERVRVSKSFIERMFGVMMPRGTRKLGLSRMNMGGMGAKMIRQIMESKGISSLEELIEDAKAHGVRIVACQMSMDVMGIRQEELIDGVELGGVATFIGSGETSDMSLFI